MMDWSWSIYNCSSLLNEYGFYHVYGNFSAFNMLDFNEKIKEATLVLKINWSYIILLTFTAYILLNLIIALFSTVKSSNK